MTEIINNTTWYEPTELSLKLLEAVGESNNRLIVSALADTIAECHKKITSLDFQLRREKEHCDELCELFFQLTGTGCCDLVAPGDES